ncbi:hypothetical protein CCACVL1_07966 [Corchorus capsularis]|uniref:Uncharacterized protein n=1 Tax=Corchorus capsularis TaxID=210143 RepID=A0A1R3J3A1_COCAP|nr:hypothetical protein CCACVL1_07966 [Corchorus capsularis]
MDETSTGPNEHASSDQNGVLTTITAKGLKKRESSYKGTNDYTKPSAFSGSK